LDCSCTKKKESPSEKKTRGNGQSTWQPGRKENIFGENPQRPEIDLRRVRGRRVESKLCAEDYKKTAERTLIAASGSGSKHYRKRITIRSPGKNKEKFTVSTTIAKRKGQKGRRHENVRKPDNWREGKEDKKKSGKMRRGRNKETRQR